MSDMVDVDAVTGREIMSEIYDKVEKDKIKELTKEFITLLTKSETNDDGKEFSPNYISSCRCMDGTRMNEIIKELKGRLTI